MKNFEPVDAEAGFTSSVITDSKRFVGRQDLISASIRAVNAKTSLIAVHGKRGVGKSSLLRQIQNLATGSYEIAARAGLDHLCPMNPRKYYTVFYTCDSDISDAKHLIRRLCTDSNETDGLLRLVPDKGKQLTEFTRSSEGGSGFDLKIARWGHKSNVATTYVSNQKTDIIQTFRNFTSSVLRENNKFWSKRDGLLILIDEFDQIRDKRNLGSIFKALSSETVKFAICGIGEDINALVEDHSSIERLIEQGAAYVHPMSTEEIYEIFSTAEDLFKKKITFDQSVVVNIANISEGYPYFAQLIGISCVQKAYKIGTNSINRDVYNSVLDDIRNGTAIPSLESRYRRAVGGSSDRALILTLLAEQKAEINDQQRTVVLGNIRATAQGLDVKYIDQLVPRLIDRKFGPALTKRDSLRGTYEFIDPVFRAYVKLRK